MSSSATGRFYASNGQIIGPDGQPFIAAGIGVVEGQQPSAATLKSQFPGINFVRLAIFDDAGAASLEAYVDQLTSAGLVVEIEDHSNDSGNTGGGAGTIFTGQTLTNELNWYSSIASAFANNPDVWFGTNNEPSEIDSSGNEDPAALSAWQQETYNAIRGTGNDNPIMVEMNSYSPASTGQGYTPWVYAGMTNIVWDIHYYGWLTDYSTNQAAVTQTLDGMIAQAQTLTSANGTVPVVIGEYGISTNGSTPDPNGNQVVQAVRSTGLGSSAWIYSSGGGDALLNSGGGLSSYGQEVAAAIAAAGADNPPGLGGSGAPSPNDTVVQVGSSAVITDAAGNAWGIDGAGQVVLNGVADTTTWNVIEIAYVNGTVWSENTSDLWWEKTSLTAPWSPSSGTFISPLPGGSGTQSPNDTVVQVGSSAVITDAAGNAWGINAAGRVVLNGVADPTTWNVIEIAYVNGTVWSENTSDLWWEKTSLTAPWSPSSGTFNSPLPAAYAAAGTGVAAAGASATGLATTGTSASANDTAVQAGSSAAITDTAGNAWTIDAAGQVALNGVADTTTWNVIRIAYVNGTIWSENTSDLWWEKTSLAAPWSPGSGTFTSPLPAASASSSISVSAGGTTTWVDPTVIGTTTVAGDTFVLSATNAVAATLGATAGTLNFIGLSGITLTAGTGNATVTADSGDNTFAAGTGSLTVTGGSGADAYVYHSGDGTLTIGDFSAAKGDTLTVDQSLQASLMESSDTHGGTLLTFSGAGGIEVANVAGLPGSAIRWA